MPVYQLTVAEELELESAVLSSEVVTFSLSVVSLSLSSKRSFRESAHEENRSAVRMPASGR